MDIKELNSLMQKCIKGKDNIKSMEQYEDALAEFLKKNKVNAEIVSLVIQGVSIDNAINFFDYFEEQNEKEITNIWKQIKLAPELKDKPGKNTVEFLTALLYLSFVSSSAIVKIQPGVISEFVRIYNSDKCNVTEVDKKAIVVDRFINEFPDSYEFPDWKNIKAASSNIKKFTDILIAILDSFEGKTHTKMRVWARKGNSQAVENMKKEELEAKIPASKVDELKEIASYYEGVDKQLRDFVYKIDELERTIDKLHSDIAVLNGEKKDLERQIVSLNGDIEKQEGKLADAKKEIDERKDLNDAFDAMKANDEKALLKDIASDLSAIYKDFKDSEKVEMNMVLGEIYREKIKDVFSILEKKGIKVE